MQTGQLKTFDSPPMIESITSDTDQTLPRYEHDCDECFFLGTIDVLDKSSKEYKRQDLWVHSHEHGDELILRFGEEGDYGCMSRDQALGVATTSKKWRLAAELYDKWVRRDRTPRRTIETIAPQLREREQQKIRGEIRLLLARSTMDEGQKIKFLAELIGELSQ